MEGTKQNPGRRGNVIETKAGGVWTTYRIGGRPSRPNPDEEQVVGQQASFNCLGSSRGGEAGGHVLPIVVEAGIETRPGIEGHGPADIGLRRHAEFGEERFAVHGIDHKRDRRV